MKKELAAACCLLFAQSAFADDFDIVNPDQGAFKKVSENLVHAYSYKALAPAEATGLTGFGIGAFGSYMSVDKDAWETLTGEDISGIGMAGIVAHKGLPFGVDLGAYYGYVPGAEADVFGAEVRYAILEGGVATPALAVRGSYSNVGGVDDIGVNSYGLDVTASKGFAFLTPYAGVGYVWGKVKTKGSVSATLDDEKVDDARLFVGLRISMLLFELTPEYERIGSDDVFNLRAGFSF
jgi:hypothetical protein